MATLDDSPTCLHGQPWSSWAERLGRSSPLSDVEDEENPKPKPVADVMRLPREDMALYGFCPERDEFYLVVCEMCGQVIKPQSLKHHIELRHSSAVDPPPKPPDPPSVSSGSSSKVKCKKALSAKSSEKLNAEKVPPPPAPPPPSASAPPPQTKRNGHRTTTPSSQKTPSPQQPPPLVPVSTPILIFSPSLNAHPPASSPAAPASATKKGGRWERRQTGTSKEREFHPDRHCGVWVGDTGKQCTRSLTCKSHALGLRRAVAGRSRPFDQLLAQHKAAREGAKAQAKEAGGASTTSTQVSSQMTSSTKQTATPSIGKQPMVPVQLTNSKASSQPPQPSEVAPPSASAGASASQGVSLELKVEIPKVEVEPPSGYYGGSGGPLLSAARRMSPREVRSAGGAGSGNAASEASWTSGVVVVSSASSSSSEPREDEAIYFPEHPKPLAMCTYSTRRLGNFLSMDRRQCMLKNAFRTAIANPGSWFDGGSSVAVESTPTTPVQCPLVKPSVAAKLSLVSRPSLNHTKDSVLLPTVNGQLRTVDLLTSALKRPPEPISSTSVSTAAATSAKRTKRVKSGNSAATPSSSNSLLSSLLGLDSGSVNLNLNINNHVTGLPNGVTTQQTLAKRGGELLVPKVEGGLVHTQPHHTHGMGREVGAGSRLVLPELGSNLLAELPGGIKVEIAPGSLASLQAASFVTDQRTSTIMAPPTFTVGSQLKTATATTTVQVAPSQITYLASAIPTAGGPVTFQPVLNQQVLNQLQLQSKSGVVTTTSIPLKLLSQSQQLSLGTPRTMVVQQEKDKS